jgi:hypothetical protein
MLIKVHHPRRRAPARYAIDQLELRLLLAAVGNPSSANLWSTTSAVTVTASSSHGARPAVRTIDGTGLDSSTGALHAGSLAPGFNPGDSMWLSSSLASSAANPNPGTVAGAHWIKYSFNQAYSLGQMWIWNYNEISSSADYRSMGMKQVTIQYSTTGGSNSAEWSTIYTGNIPLATPGASPTYNDPVNLSVNFNGASARYIVITAASGLNRNWSNNAYDESGLSEVRFNLAAAPSWRDVSYRNTLTATNIQAKFQAGLLYELKNPATAETLLSIDPATLSASQAIFGSSGVNLDASTVNQTVTSTSVNTTITFTGGGSWTINWSLNGNDLVLQTSATSTSSVTMFAYTIDNGDISTKKLVTVDQNGTGHAIQAPYTGNVFGGDRTSMPATMTQPLVALFQGTSTGWFVEGRDPNVGPSNLRAYGEGSTADLVISRGFFHLPTTTPSLYEVRIRTYQGAWQDAADPYTAWMQSGLGYVPLTLQSPSWPANIKTQAYVTVGDYATLNTLAQRFNPAETYIGRQAEYRNYSFDHGYPDYTPTTAASQWIGYARSLGFHVGVHVNVGSIDRSNTALLTQMQPGLLQVGTDGQGNPIWDGTQNNAYCSAAYAPWRTYLVNAVAAVVAAGADVIYLDQTNGILGNYYVNGVTAPQGVIMLEEQLKAAYPNIAIQTEQFNSMSSARASFALTTLNLGHPLSGYIFTKFIKVVPEGYYYQPTDVATMDQFQNWGHFTPGASSDETWLQIAGAFQLYDLVPDSRLPLNANQLSGFSGSNGATGFFEKTGTTRKFVVYRPGFLPLTFGLRQSNITQWSGPGYIKDWQIYNGNTMLGLEPNQTYYMDPNVTLNQTRFHLTGVPADFLGYRDDNRRITPQELSTSDNATRFFFSGHGTVSMYVPDLYDVYLDNQKVNVDRNTDTASVTINASTTSPSIIRGFKRLETTLNGKWASLPWSQPTYRTYVSTSGTLFPPDGFFTYVSGTGFLIGKIPDVQSVRLRGSYKMRDDAFYSLGDAVLRINGTEVMRLAPGSGPPFTAKAFDVDVSAFAGQYVMIEFNSDGEIHGPDAADWIAPEIVLTQPPPAVTGALFDYKVAPNSVQFTFNEDINATLSAIQVRNVATNALISPTSYSIDHTARTVTWFFNAPLADANYRATLTASQITNVLGNPMSANATFDFFSLMADANHDRTVDSLDFNAMLASYGDIAKDFSQGNFNYDTKVDTADFNLLAGHFGQTLPAPAPVAGASALSAGPSIFGDQSVIAPLSEKDESALADILV